MPLTNTFAYPAKHKGAAIRALSDELVQWLLPNSQGANCVMSGNTVNQVSMKVSSPGKQSNHGPRAVANSLYPNEGGRRRCWNAVSSCRAL